VSDGDSKLIAIILALKADLAKMRDALIDKYKAHMSVECPACGRVPVSTETWNLMTKQDDLIKKIKDESAEKDKLLAECLEAGHDYPSEQGDAAVQSRKLRAQICKTIGVEDPWDDDKQEWNWGDEDG